MRDGITTIFFDDIIDVAKVGIGYTIAILAHLGYQGSDFGQRNPRHVANILK